MKEVWLNIYKSRRTGDLDTSDVFSSEEEAIESVADNQSLSDVFEFIKTVKLDIEINS